jgi:hypothetical protein
LIAKVLNLMALSFPVAFQAPAAQKAIAARAEMPSRCRDDPIDKEGSETDLE